jgi:hypothetical protein
MIHGRNGVACAYHNYAESRVYADGTCGSAEADLGLPSA